MLNGEIDEYPYTGIIYRVIQGKGKEKDTERVLYEGVMDLYMATDEVGRTLQTSNYIVSIPLTKDDYGDYIIPQKGDKVSLTRYSETIQFEVDNAEPSQLAGISAYCARRSWKQNEE